MAAAKKARTKAVPVKVTGISYDDVQLMANLVRRLVSVLSALSPVMWYEAWELKWQQPEKIPMKKKQLLAKLRKLQHILEKQENLYYQTLSDEEECW